MMLKVMDSMALGEVPKVNLRTWFRLVSPDPLSCISCLEFVVAAKTHYGEYCNIGWIP
jgi:hypothetical protein